MLGPEVHAAGEVCGLLQECGMGVAKHAGINADLAPLHSTSSCISASIIKTPGQHDGMLRVMTLHCVDRMGAAILPGQQRWHS